MNATTGRDARGRLLSAQTTVTGVAGTLLQESMTWSNNSRQLSYTGVRAAAGGVVSWSDGRQYLYTAGRLQLNSETYGAGPQGGTKTLIHNYDFNQSGGLGVRTASQISEPTNGVLWNSFVGDGSSGGQDAFSRVTSEYVGSERYNLRAHGRAVGAKDVTLQLNGNVELGSSDTSLLPADPLGNWQSGDWEKWLHLEPGNYDLKAEATHPSGEKVQSSNVNFTVLGGAVPVGVTYDALGQITQRSVANGQRLQIMTWDAQGRLIKVIQTETTLLNIGWQWEATYDGMNRRVQTKSTPLISKPQVGVVLDTAKATREDTWYDPLVEFLEVAVELNGVRQWAIHGPDLNGGYGGLQGMGGLEAWVEESTGQSTGMVDDSYGHVVGSISTNSTTQLSTFSWQQTRCVGYGPQALTPIYRVAEGANLAQATAWRGKRQDVTGFYYMGARYYDAQSTRFLSTDPMGHAASMSLYDYANGDPINFVDPRGRSVAQIWNASVSGSASTANFLNHLQGGSSVGNKAGESSYNITINGIPISVEFGKSLAPSQHSIDFIISQETGGRAYYEKLLSKPSYPGNASGVTIGAGYDLGYNTKDQIASDWAPYVSAEDLIKLQNVSGKKRDAAKTALSSVSGIVIPLSTAIKVFETKTLPRFVRETENAFPGSTNLDPDSQGALVSLVFNRGSGMVGNDRKEMREIRDAVKNGQAASVPQLFLDMKHLWIGKGLPGVIERRDEEAKLFDAGVMHQIIQQIQMLNYSQTILP